MLMSGFKTQSEIFANPPTFWPKNFSFDAYDFVFRREDVLRYVRNSVYIVKRHSICPPIGCQASPRQIGETLFH